MTEDRYPGYDVLSKQAGLSWNEATRRTIEQRLDIRQEPQFFDAGQWQTLGALCDRIVPQTGQRPTVPLAAMLDARLTSGRTDGFRRAKLPEQGEAWRRGLGALDAESQRLHSRRFHELSVAQQDALLLAVQRGDATCEAWGDMAPAEFFSHRVLLDIAAAYYSHPSSWSEVGFGGPASPRGYVRMEFDRRDPWEAAEALEADPDSALRAERENRRVR
ncbi:MAG TPA: gluconate 2-dehydrogenase subunit 3 family protein [Steroidobacteraceae bacterium]|jgi:hypothetical protein|nr:gluconate 2-dehydrogenase subunit 3 family protein [Steroidobacteraceae bacterium]